METLNYNFLAYFIMLGRLTLLCKGSKGEHFGVNFDFCGSTNMVEERKKDRGSSPLKNEKKNSSSPCDHQNPANHSYLAIILKYINSEGGTNYLVRVIYRA